MMNDTEKTERKRFFEPDVFLKGILMGTADLIPGVSGGTMALITGIYERFLSALSALNPNNLKLLFQGKFKEFWKAVDGNFLLSLFTGILVAVFSLSKLIHYLLDNYPVPVWAFFFGLIAASAVFIIRQTPYKDWKTWIFIIAGAGIAWWITGLLPDEGPQTWWYLLISGIAASIAMILPGISGSYILVLLGSYTFVLASVHELKIFNLIVFTVGVVIGLLGFSKILKWFFAHYRDYTLALMGGFLIGSLRQVWPWKQVLMTKVIDGKEIIVKTRTVWPWQYEDEAYTFLSLVLMVLAVVLIVIFEKVQQKYG